MLGLWKTNLALQGRDEKTSTVSPSLSLPWWRDEPAGKTHLSRSSTQSISLPRTPISARLSMMTRTPSCSTTSSKRPGLSTYSRW